MVCHTIILSKVIGAVSIGALAGSLATASNVSLPTLLLTSPQDTTTLLKSITNKTLSIVKPLSIAAFSSLAYAYVFSRPSGKHPYLLYAAFSIPLSFAVAYVKGLPVYASLTNLLDSQASADAKPKSEETVAASSSSSEDSSNANLEGSVYNITKSDLDSEDETRPAPKTEVATEPKKDSKTVEVKDGSESVQDLVSEHVQKLIKYGRIVTAVTSTAFLIVTVGIYGDLK